MKATVGLQAETCGMNLRRKADLAAIKAESARPDSLAIADSFPNASSFFLMFCLS